MLTHYFFPNSRYICWIFVTPVIVCVITFLAWVYFEKDQFEDYVYPAGAEAIGWGLELFPVAVVLFTGIFTVWKRKRAGKTTAFIKPGPLMKPSRLWGPRPDSGLPTPALQQQQHQENGKF